MDPNHNIGNTGPGNPQGMNLPPQPAPEASMPGGLQPEVRQSLGPEAVSVPSAPPPAAVTWLPPSVPVKPAGASGDTPAGQLAAGAPAVAVDGDVIEKEWVVKAKHIVEQTKQDPYKQTKELHKFRAEYMKKRYNKIIEPVEE